MLIPYVPAFPYLIKPLQKANHIPCSAFGLSISLPGHFA